MSDRKTLLASLMSDLGLGATVQSLIGGKLCDGAGDAVILEDPYAQVELARYADCGAELAAEACLAAAAAQLAGGGANFSQPTLGPSAVSNMAAVQSTVSHAAAALQRANSKQRIY